MCFHGPAHPPLPLRSTRAVCLFTPGGAPTIPGLECRPGPVGLGAGAAYRVGPRPGGKGYRRVGRLGGLLLFAAPSMAPQLPPGPGLWARPKKPAGLSVFVSGPLPPLFRGAVPPLFTSRRGGPRPGLRRPAFTVGPPQKRPSTGSGRFGASGPGGRRGQTRAPWFCRAGAREPGRSSPAPRPSPPGGPPMPWPGPPPALSPLRAQKHLSVSPAAEAACAGRLDAALAVSSPAAVAAVGRLC